jgi:hypothetical protein
MGEYDSPAIHGRDVLNKAAIRSPCFVTKAPSGREGGIDVAVEQAVLRISGAICTRMFL